MRNVLFSLVVFSAITLMADPWQITVDLSTQKNIAADREDSSWIGYQDSSDGNWNLWYFSLGDSSNHQITDFPEDEIDPSADGSRIAFVQSGDDFKYLWLYYRDGDSLSQLTNTPWAITNPSLSRCYVAAVSYEFSSPNIILVNTVSLDTTYLTGDNDVFVQNLSPFIFGGDTVLYVHCHDGYRDIMMCVLSTGIITQLTINGEYYSPKGSGHYVVAEDHNVGHEIVLLDIVTMGMITVSDSCIGLSIDHFSPDVLGNWVTFITRSFPFSRYFVRKYEISTGIKTEIHSLLMPGNTLAKPALSSRGTFWSGTDFGNFDIFAVLIEDSCRALSAETLLAAVPAEINLFVYPNPFNGACNIEAPRGSKVKIFNVLGGCVAEFVGPTWVPKNLSSGVYAVICVTPDGKKCSKEVLYVK